MSASRLIEPPFSRPRRVRNETASVYHNFAMTVRVPLLRRSRPGCERKLNRTSENGSIRFTGQPSSARVGCRHRLLLCQSANQVARFSQIPGLLVEPDSAQRVRPEPLPLHRHRKLTHSPKETGQGIGRASRQWHHESPGRHDPRNRSELPDRRLLDPLYGPHDRRLEKGVSRLVEAGEVAGSKKPAFRNLWWRRLQVDELWGFNYCKQKNVRRKMPSGSRRG